MASFPTIYVHGAVIHTPVVGDFEDTMAQEPAIRSQFDGGYVNTRARFTRITRKWIARYAGVSQANKEIIRLFERARLGGSDNFTWTSPETIDEVSYAFNVRFFGSARYTPWPNTNFLQWNIEFVLEEV